MRTYELGVKLRLFRKVAKKLSFLFVPETSFSRGVGHLRGDASFF